jgi:transposase
MHNASQAPLAYAGCDTGKSHIDVCLQAGPSGMRHRRFANTPAGLDHLARWLGQAGTTVHVVVEASGRYSLDLALRLHEADGVGVMVANPRALKDYRRATMERSKTDAVDAACICDYARHMPFAPWQPPPHDVLELQQIARRIDALVAEAAREKNRLQSAQTSKTASRVVTNDIGVNRDRLRSHATSSSASRSWRSTRSVSSPPATRWRR